MTVFFTADTHFGHANILKYCKRPFLCESDQKHFDAAQRIGDPVLRDHTIRNIPISRESAERMDHAILANINAVVGPEDTLYHLGDFCFGDMRHWRRCREGIRCKQIILCLGNHDKERQVPPDSFTMVHPHGAAVEIECEGHRFVLNHYAMRVWNRSHHGVMHLYGHSHGSLADDPHTLSMDVGVDTHSFRPYSMDEVLQVMREKIYRPVDHHGARTAL